MKTFGPLLLQLQKESKKSFLKLRGGAKETKKFKTYETEDPNILDILSIFRSLKLFSTFSSHEKCALSKKKTRDNLCQFCLLRSLTIKSNDPKGRTSIKPFEFHAAIPENMYSKSLTENLAAIVNHLSIKVPQIKKNFNIKWNCNKCPQNDFVLELLSEQTN